MRRVRALVIFLVLAGIAALAPKSAQAQFENYTWYFGTGLGLDFSTAPPSVLRDGRTSSYEGSASISDPNTGKILFYTDGVTVWNSVHQPMANGFDLASHLSSTQPAVIVPDPGNASRYYIFTADQSGYAGTPRGINYSVVDMRRNGGLGDVVEKNTPLLPRASEKITAIRICNGSAYWVIAHEYVSNRFFAWKVDASGVGLPVVSDVGTMHGPGAGDGIGWMTASPDGSKLALAFFERSQQDGNVEMFQFDAETGTISGALLFRRPRQPYGIAFSPSGNKVYVTSVGHIDQFDISNWNYSAIQNSWQVLPSVTQENGAIKLGPDGKLYVQHSAYLGVISYPELRGAACQYVENSLPMNSQIQWGLPNNIDAHSLAICGPPEAHIKSFISPVCEGECVDFFDSSHFGATSWKWEFEGAQPSTSSDKNPATICYPEAGTYRIQLTASNSVGSSIDVKYIKVQKCLPPDVSLRDTIICVKNCIAFVDTSTGDYTRKWEFNGGTPSTFAGKDPPQVCFDYPGSYEVKLTASNQWGIDTAIANITVKDCPWPVALSEYDTVVCAGSSVMFTDRSANQPNAWEWVFTAGTPATANTQHPGPIVYTTPGTYNVRQIVHNTNGVDTNVTQIRVTKCDPPVAKLSHLKVCQGDCIELQDQSTNDPSSWNWILRGPTEQSYAVKDPGQICFTTPGTYTLKLIVRNTYGEDSTTSTILVHSSSGWTTPSLEIIQPIAVCSTLDTFITVYSGCASLALSELTFSDPSVTALGLPASIKANDSVRIPVVIAPLTVGAANATMSVKLGSEEHTLSIRFIGGSDEENFKFGDLDGDFQTLACELLAKDFSIANNACADHSIVYLGIEPPGTGFTIVLDDLSLVVPGNGVKQMQIRYDASVNESSKAELIIRTQSGAEQRYQLRGSRLLPATGTLRFDAQGPSAILPNQPTTARIGFKNAVIVELAPEEIEIAFTYNTDLISASSVTGLDGWSIASQKESEGRLSLKLARTRDAIIANSGLVEIQFKSFITGESTTEIALERLVCNPDDPDFERCVFDLETTDSSRITILPICGTPAFESLLGRRQALTVSIKPHPVSAGGDLRFSLVSADPALIGQPVRVSLIDLVGRRTDLLTTILASREQDLSVALDGVPSGIYVLQIEAGAERIVKTLVVQ